MMQTGQGIGLNITNRLASLLQKRGGIRAKSVLNKGSTFHFLIDCFLQDHRMQDGNSHRSEDLDDVSEADRLEMKIP